MVFLGLEGVANVAEETINPQRTIKVGFSSALITLIALCLLVFAGAVGVGGWENIVYRTDGSTSDSPLPLALINIVGENNFLYHLLITVGLFGLIASFHGLILAAEGLAMNLERCVLPRLFLVKYIRHFTHLPMPYY